MNQKERGVFLGAAHNPATGPAKNSTWIAGDGPPLLAHVHVPADQQARGVVVLCSPVAKEHVDTYRGMALVGQLLAERGIAAVRFDFPAVGDSARNQDDSGLAGEWLASVERVLRFAGSLGVGAPVVAGLRLGGLIAGIALTQLSDGVAAGGLALWDPVTSGSRYLRQQRLIYEVSTADVPSSGDLVHILGADLSPETADELKKLSLDSVDHKGLGGIPVMLAVRSDAASTPATRTLAGRLQVEPEIVTGHEEFTEPVGYVGEIPADSVDRLLGWLDKQFGAAVKPVHVEPQLSVVMGDVVESIERIGDDGLFAIRSEPHQSSSSGNVLVIHGTSNEHRVGPARLWVEVARSAAAAGHSVVRFDRRGTGESGVVAKDEKTPIYDAESKEDALTVANAAAANNRVVHTGICSGAWLSAYAAAEVGADAVVVVNTMVWTMRPRVMDRDEIDRLNEMHGVHDRTEEAKVRVRAVIRRMLPYPAWLWLGKCGSAQVPEVMLRTLRERGVEPHVVLSPEDTDWFYRQRGGRSLERLQRRGWNQSLVVSTSGDHAAYEYGMRQLVRDEVAATMRYSGQNKSVSRESVSE